MYKPIFTESESMRRYGNSRILVFSPKLNRKIILFNNLEYYNYLLQEFDSNIVFFCEKPLKISIKSDGKLKKSIFDMVKIDKSNIETFVQVAYKSSLDQHKMNTNHFIQSKWCELHKKNFELFTDDMIKGKEHLLTNYRTLLNLIANSSLIPELEEKYLNLIGNKIVKLGSLFNENYVDQIEFWGTIANMIHKGIIFIDLESNPVTFESEVRNAKIF